MKLVDILAHGLAEWPRTWQGCDGVQQGDNGLLHAAGPNYSLVLLGVANEFDLADDRDSAVVTREQWQAARDNLKPGGLWMPPVGQECEFLWTGSRDKTFEVVKVLARDGDMVIFRWKNGDLDERRQELVGAYGLQFRPLRTAEQLAAEVREAAIEALCKAGAGRSGPPLCRAAGEALYDAGCRVPMPDGVQS